MKISQESACLNRVRRQVSSSRPAKPLSLGTRSILAGFFFSRFHGKEVLP